MDFNGKTVAAGHTLAGLKIYLSGRNCRPDMHTENGIYSFKGTSLYIFFGLSSYFFCHLEDQLYSTMDLISVSA